MRLIISILLLLISLNNAAASCGGKLSSAKLAIDVRDLRHVFKKFAVKGKQKEAKSDQIGGPRKQYLNRKKTWRAKHITKHSVRLNIRGNGLPSILVTIGIHTISKILEKGCDYLEERKKEIAKRCNRVLVPASYLSVMELFPNHNIPISGSLVVLCGYSFQVEGMAV